MHLSGLLKPEWLNPQRERHADGGAKNAVVKCNPPHGDENLNGFAPGITAASDAASCQFRSLARRDGCGVRYTCAGEAVIAQEHFHMLDYAITAIANLIFDARTLGLALAGHIEPRTIQVDRCNFER
jgi:hypothetical protein